MDVVHEVVIVGAGIAGLATAIALHRVGVRALVLESNDELRTTGAALSLFPNAWRALDVLGVAQKLIPLYKPFQSARGKITNVDTGITQDQYLSISTNAMFAMGLLAVHRKTLLHTLADELPPGTIKFSSKLSAIKTQQDDSSVTALHLEGGTIIRAKILIGCDGVHSVVAQWLGLSPPIDAGRSAVRGLSVYPGGHGFSTTIRQFTSVGKRAGLVPLNDTDVYWFMTNISTPKEKEIAYQPALIQKEVLENLARGFPEEYLKVVREADLSTVTWAPLMYRRPWDVALGPTRRGRVVVAGDAMHPMTPDLGQGGGLALEDAVVLGRCIGSGGDAGKGIERFVKERRWRAAGMIAGAYMTGWVQQGWPGVLGWAVRWFRDNVFYRFVFRRILLTAYYDCGLLPTVK